MLYLIGLGLNFDGISMYGLETAKRCKKVYLENYTVDFPYSKGELEEKTGIKKIVPADREFIESEEIVDEAVRNDVALLIYGSPLTATTHISLIEEAKRMNVRYKVIYSASVFDAIAETGLQIYKFGKVTSMPAWKTNFTPDSFMEVVKENQTIGAHSLILVDIGLEFQEAREQLKKATENHKIKLKKIVVCSRLGTKNSRMFYKPVEGYKEFAGINPPYCFVIPGKLHFMEKQVLENL
jgi:diphthine synthase